jgi:hypothetical protein
MRFAAHDQLDRPRWIRQDANQTLRILQEHVHAFVGCETPGKSERQPMLIEDQ